MRPPVPYFGGKITLGPVIAAMFPPHDHYVEPYAGALAVLLAKAPSRMETVNDLDHALVTFWRVLRDRPADMVRACALTPHARAEHQAAYEPAGDDLEVARRVFVQLTQGRGGLRLRTGWRHYVDPIRSAASLPDYLDGYVGRILPAAERLAGVSLECRPALDLVRGYGAKPQVLLYVDPPYLGVTRGAGDASRAGTSRYVHEMLDGAAHTELAEALHACRAAVVLSGYASDLYDRELYPTWYRHEVAASTGQGGTWANRVEVLWSNRPLRTVATLFDVAGGGRLMTQPWRLSWRADPRARRLADRHYNRQSPGSPQFTPPGRVLVLLTDDAVWATSWPMAEYAQHAWAGGWINSLFRRESGCPDRASDLIRAAVAATCWRWPTVPALGMVTFVDRARVRHKRDPGRCYLRAGFEPAGATEGGLLAFRLSPDRMPDPLAPAHAQLRLWPVAR